jgi:hypothetical protein
VGQVKAPGLLEDPLRDLSKRPNHDALLSDAGPWARSVRRRRVMLPLLWPLARGAPRLRVPARNPLPGDRVGEALDRRLED